MNAFILLQFLLIVNRQIKILKMRYDLKKKIKIAKSLWRLESFVRTKQRKLDIYIELHFNKN